MTMLVGFVGGFGAIVCGKTANSGRELVGFDQSSDGATGFMVVMADLECDEVR